MLRPLHKHVRSESGAALIEFALVLPILLLLLLGIVDFAKAFNYSNDTTHLANEGARWAAVNRNPGGTGVTLQDYIQQQADTKELRQGGTDSVKDPLCVEISFPTNSATGTSRQIGDPVTVKVTSQYHLIPFVGKGIAPDIHLQSTSTMRLEQRPTNYSASTCT
jgi:Flp pilus assembly protein TadG